MVPFQHFGFVAHRHVDSVDQLDCVFLAGIVAAPEHAEAQQVFLRNAKLGQHRGFKRGRFMVKRQGEIGQADHGKRLSPGRAAKASAEAICARRHTCGGWP
jgi:hypothetical protein